MCLEIFLSLTGVPIKKWTRNNQCHKFSNNYIVSIRYKFDALKVLPAGGKTVSSLIRET